VFRRPALWFFAALPALPGCFHLAHPAPDACLADWRQADDVPDESKSCVFIFLFNGLDPIEHCNLASVRDHLHHLGFGKTYYGQSAHRTYFEDRMRYIHDHCPGAARFVVIGFGTGARAAQQLAMFADGAGIPVELVIYLSPRRLDRVVEPPSARTLTVTGDHWLSGGIPDCGGDAVMLFGVGKSALPTHPETLAVLEREITLVALGVAPAPRRKAPRVALVDPIPPPREVIPRPAELPPEWQFLRPRYPWEATPLPPPAIPEMLPPPRVVPQLPPPALSR
jgi:hypothetical protein